MRIKKHTLLRNTLRNTLRSKERFFSLFGIIAISTGFFAGLKVTSIDMKDSAEQYYSDTALMDLHLVSNVGFCEEELQRLSERTEISQLYGGYSEIAFLPVSDSASDQIVKVYSLPDHERKAGNPINTPTLTEGRMPERPGECLIEIQTPDCYQVGDTIRIQTADTESTILSTIEFTAVGRADWSMYTDFQRGTTTIGNGSIDCFLLVPADAFASDVYTDIILTLNDTKGVNSFSERYLDLVSAQADSILNDKTNLSAPRAAQLRESAESELAEQRKALDEGLKEYQAGSADLELALSEGEKELNRAKVELDETEASLSDAREIYERDEAAYLKQKEEFDSREQTILAQERTANGELERMKALCEEIDRVKDVIAGYRDSTVAEPLTDDLTQMIEDMSEFDSEEFNLSGSMRKYFLAPVHSDEKEMLEDTITFYLGNCKVLMQNKISATEANAKQTSYGRNALESVRHELSGKEKTLSAEKAKLEETESALSAAKEEYEKKQRELAELEQSGHERLDNLKQELEDGESAYAAGVSALDHISDQIKWYAFDRSSNPGWSSYGQDAERVDRIARIFPVFFLLVAALVCLTTVTRMVEEQRTEIGTCKALGYSTYAVSAQFLLYTVICSVLGTAVGTAIGFQVFPRVIFICYEMMYHYPQISCPFRWNYALGCLAAALLCTGLTALAASGAVLRETPAKLMRPKPPKNGKRILLEKWKWLWRKCSFHAKVTLRNFFRYRSRALMTVVGICGCTALLVTGFGLYHSIAAIVDLHYGEIFTYDMYGLYDEDPVHRDLISDSLSSCESVTAYEFGMMKSGTASVGKNSYEISFMVPENPEQFSEFVNIRDRKSQKVCQLDDESVIINEKLGRLLGVKAGGMITLEGAAHPVKIQAFMENYVFNRVVMTPALYDDLFGDYESNCFFANLTDGADENAVAEEILESDALLRLEFTSQGGNNFRKLVRALGYVVVLILVSSGLLAFAVLYNLANINIIERKRELATIKVLGFYDKEVYSYIFRENLLSSAIGMLAGLAAGVFLCRYVVRTAEVDVVMFAPDIPWYCFALAAAVTMCFTLFVNLILRRKLKAIDMAGSMKAIE